MRTTHGIGVAAVCGLVLVTGCASATEDIEGSSDSALAGRKRRYEGGSATCLASEAFSSANLSALTRLRVGPGSADLDGPVLRPFFSDGCSVAPDDVPLSRDDGWQACCVQHDVRYWLGGTRAEKGAADAELETCIEEAGHPGAARLYRAAVERFGGPDTHHLYRWGYGWNRRRSFDRVPPAAEEQAMAMYGESLAALTRRFVEDDYALERVCRTDDPGLNEITARDRTIYDLLATKLRAPDTVAWARLSYFNRVLERFEVKLQHCESPITITFSKEDDSLIDFASGCP